MVTSHQRLGRIWIQNIEFVCKILIVELVFLLFS